MKRRYKIIAYLLVFITLFICFERNSYASGSSGSTTTLGDEFVNTLAGNCNPYYEINIKGAEGIEIPRLYV